MGKIKVKVGIIGHLPFYLNKAKIKSWQSDLFEVVGNISCYNINVKESDDGFWGYLDDTLEQELPPRTGEDIFIGITYVPLQGNYFARRLRDNRVVISYFELCNILTQENIPLENLFFRVLYPYCCVYLSNTNEIPQQLINIPYIHHDTRCCVFDKCGHKTDVIYSTYKPQLCESCVIALKEKKVPDDVIKKTNKELKSIKRSRYWMIARFIKKHPIISLLITFLVGMIVSIIANYVYDALPSIKHQTNIESMHHEDTPTVDKFIEKDIKIKNLNSRL